MRVRRRASNRLEILSFSNKEYISIRPFKVKYKIKKMEQEAEYIK